MYQPPHHREDRIDVQHALIREHPFGTLITLGRAGIVANSIPFVLESAEPYGILKGHIARANSQWRDYDPTVDALVVFQGVQGYITPSWYETKRETGKVVPTWNYVTVHAWGPMSIVEDSTWLGAQIAELTREREQHRAEPWAVSDAPGTFIQSQLKGIVGVEIPISRIEGKWKVSQNRPATDRHGVVAGLRAAGGDENIAMAELVAAGGAKAPE